MQLCKDQERESAVKSLTLEHELELDSLRHKLDNMEKSAKNEAEVAKLKEELMMRENDIEALRRKTRLLETAEKERFSTEKEKIVQVMLFFKNSNLTWSSFVEMIIALVDFIPIQPQLRFLNWPTPASFSLIFVFSNTRYNFYNKKM